jgi:hypothetical protein
MLESRRNALFLFAFLCTGLLAACSKQEDISRYSVPRLSVKTGLEPAAGSGKSASSEPDRMLVALIQRGEQTWFFKLTGPESVVEPEKKQFIAFIRSLKFGKETDQPEWELPEGWRRLPSTPTRFATLQIGPMENSLELTVIPLRTAPGEFDDYVLANINRWREQLVLPPFDSTEAMRAGEPAGWLTELQTADGAKAIVANMLGKNIGASRHKSAMASDLPPSHPPISGSLPSPPVGSSPREPELTFKTPEGWSVGQVGGMRAAAFEVTEGEQKVEVTAISLPATGSDLLANVNRWREQLDLGPMTQDELAKSLELVPIGESTAEYIEIYGAEDSAPRKAIFGAIANAGSVTWFFKLTGNAELAQRERGRFQEFVQSVKIPTGMENRTHAQ